MPVNPDDGARRASRVADAVTELELHLLRLVRDTLAHGIDQDGWADRQHQQLRLLRARLVRLVGDQTPDLLRLVADVVDMAYTTGQALGLGDVDDLGVRARVVTDPLERISVLVSQAQGLLTVALSEAAQRVATVYAEAVNAGAAEVLGGQVTRVGAAQHVLDRLAADGVRGFTDAAGRNWSLTSYAEMAVRTVSGQAAVQGHTDQLAAAGLDLVIVSDAPRECPLCRPWEGKVLSLGGRVGAVIVPSLTGGEPVRVDVAGTLDDARRAGFQHPNCRHSISAYLPGATRKVKPRADPDGYELVQRQRAMERKVRQWKRRGAVALDDEAARHAATKVREWQAAIREHVDQHDLKRLSRREQIDQAI